MASCKTFLTLQDTTQFSYNMKKCSHQVISSFTTRNPKNNGSSITFFKDELQPTPTTTRF
uniref:Uncharacterized protein n=1 Tax=Anguilla anguilla TaxID=7936 RepID=A0A0E9W5R7_ANGAN